MSRFSILLGELQETMWIQGDAGLEKKSVVSSCKMHFRDEVMGIKECIPSHGYKTVDSILRNRDIDR